MPVSHNIIAKSDCWTFDGWSVMLVKAVIVNSTTHLLMVYRWPRSLLIRLDKASCDFILSGDVKIQGRCVVSWDRICTFKDVVDMEFSSFVININSLLWRLA